MRRALLALPLVAAAAPAPPPPINPGYWEVTSAATSVSMPGIPSFLTGFMKHPTTNKRCVTPEQASHALIQQYGSRQNCTMVGNRISGGTIDVTALCPEKDGAQTRIHVEGSYTPVSYSTTGTILGTGGKHGDMRIDFNEAGKRIGECPAGKTG